MQFNKQTLEILPDLEKDPHKVGLTLSIKQLEYIIKEASKYYYSSDKEIISDDTFDIIQDILKNKDPNNLVLKQVGSIEPEINKVKLPCYMGSMSKIKPDTRELNHYLEQYKGSYIISEKLDGLSGLLVIDLGNKPGNTTLYSRGKGEYGEDLSGLLLNINLFGNNGKNDIKPTYKDNIHTMLEKALKINNSEKNKKTYSIDKSTKITKLVIRGEIIMKNKTFESKYSKTYSKGRSMVAGASRKQDPKIVKDIDYVAYEIVEPVMTADNQFKLLEHLGFNTAKNKVEKTLDTAILKKLLLKYKDDSKYIIDGIIITDVSKNYPREVDKNPKHSVAFKMMLSEQTKETKVVNVEYNASKHGVLIPTVQYEQILIGGDKFNYATGFSASYIKDNKLGPGAVINIVISGGVIPYIYKIVKSADDWQKPDSKIKWKWNSSNIHSVLENLDDNVGVRLKRIIHFFNIVEVENFGPGNVERLYNAGYDSISKILKLTPDIIAQIDGFQLKSAQKIHTAIHDKLDKSIDLYILMVASNAFGNGFGKRKIKPIIDKYPNIMKDSSEITLAKLQNIDGYSGISSLGFINGFKKFKEWTKRHPEVKYEVYNTKKRKIHSDGKMEGQIVVFTGFDVNDLKDKIINEGGNIGSGVNSKTTLLVAKKTDGNSSKLTKARSLNIKIISLETMQKMV